MRVSHCTSYRQEHQRLYIYLSVSWRPFPDKRSGGERNELHSYNDQLWYIIALIRLQTSQSVLRMFLASAFSARWRTPPPPPLGLHMHMYGKLKSNMIVHSGLWYTCLQHLQYRIFYLYTGTCKCLVGSIWSSPNLPLHAHVAHIQEEIQKAHGQWNYREVIVSTNIKFLALLARSCLFCLSLSFLFLF